MRRTIAATVGVGCAPTNRREGGGAASSQRLVATARAPHSTSSSLLLAAATMAFRQVRDHSNMPFADTFSADTQFWRQRVQKEQRRANEPSLFAEQNLRGLPANPFRDSAGMLLGPGVSRRDGPTPLGVLAPQLAAYRSAVQSSPRAFGVLTGRPAHNPAFAHVPASPVDSSPAARANRGAACLRPPTPLMDYRVPPAFGKVCAHTRTGPPRPPTHSPTVSDAPCALCFPSAPLRSQHLRVEAPRMLISSSQRQRMPRARLDARMYSPSPG